MDPLSPTGTSSTSSGSSSSTSRSSLLIRPPLFSPDTTLLNHGGTEKGGDEHEQRESHSQRGDISSLEEGVSTSRIEDSHKKDELEKLSEVTEQSELSVETEVSGSTATTTTGNPLGFLAVRFDFGSGGGNSRRLLSQSSPMSILSSSSLSNSSSSSVSSVSVSSFDSLELESDVTDRPTSVPVTWKPKLRIVDSDLAEEATLNSDKSTMSSISESTITTVHSRIPWNDKGKEKVHESEPQANMQKPMTPRSLHQRKGSDAKSTSKTHSRRKSSGGTGMKMRSVPVYYEKGFSRDFFLIVALCFGLACASVLIVRPAVLRIFEQPSDDFEFYNT